MTIRECTIQICRENGMNEEELAKFIKDQDEHASPQNLAEVNTLTVEALGPMQDTFWFVMRKDLTAIIKRWRNATGQQTITE